MKTLPTDTILRRILDSYGDRIPKNEHVTIEVENRDFLLTSEHLRIRLWRMKGYGLDAAYREASVDVLQRTLTGRDPKVALDALYAAVSYLVSMVFPRPLPRFRIRRDARWGRS